MKEYTPNILFRSLHYELLNRASLAVMDVADSAGRIVTSPYKTKKGTAKGTLFNLLGPYNYIILYDITVNYIVLFYIE